jgi:hypothetical protein
VRSEAKAERLQAAAEAADLDNRVRPLVLDVSDHAAVAPRSTTCPTSTPWSTTPA